jgi:hypothetical protein
MQGVGTATNCRQIAAVGHIYQKSETEPRKTTWVTCTNPLFFENNFGKFMTNRKRALAYQLAGLILCLQAVAQWPPVHSAGRGR